MKTNLYSEINNAFAFKQIDNKLNNRNDPLMSGLTDTQNTQIKSVLKKLNQRMTEFEKQGLTNTAGYKNLVSLATALPNNSKKKSFNGRLRIIQSTKELTPNQVLRALAVSGNSNTLTKTATESGRKVARKRYADFDTMPKAVQNKLAKNTANTLGDLHEFIVNHTDAYYWTANGGNIDLESAVHRSGTLNEDELAYMLDIKERYEKGEKELQEKVAEWNRNMW